MSMFRGYAPSRVHSLGLALLVGMAIFALMPAWGAFAAEQEPENLIGTHRFIDLSVTVTFNDGVEEQKLEASERLIVKRIVGVEVTNHENDPYDWRYVSPQGTAEFEVTVRNTGNDIDMFEIKPEGVPGNWQVEILHADGTPLTGDLELRQGELHRLIVRLTAPARGNGGTEGSEAHVRLRVESTFARQSWYNGPQNARQAVSGVMRAKIVDAELALSVGDAIAVNPSDYQKESFVTYSAGVKNTGSGKVTNLVWTHPVPKELDLDSISISVNGGGGCNAYVDRDNGNVVATCANIDPGQSVLLTFTVKVLQHTEPGPLSTPPMIVTYKDSIGNSFTIQENIQRVTINTHRKVSIAILGIKINDGAMTSVYEATRGDEVTLIARVRNEGNVMDDYVVSLGNTLGSITWQPSDQSANNIGPGNEVVVEFETTIPREVANGDEDEITLTVESPDRPELTDQASVKLLIVTPMINVSLTANKPNPFPGEEVVITLTVKNSGGYAADNLRVEAPIPDGTTYKVGSLTASKDWAKNDASDPLEIGPGTLDPGETLVVTYTVVVHEWSI